VGRHQLKDEGKPQEDSATPPTHSSEKISRLPDPDQCVRRRARAAKARSEATALPALQQNGEDQDDAVDDEQSEKKRVKH